jgi:hypothetical protein
MACLLVLADHADGSGPIVAMCSLRGDFANGGASVRMRRLRRTSGPFASTLTSTSGPSRVIEGCHCPSGFCFRRIDPTRLILRRSTRETGGPRFFTAPFFRWAAAPLLFSSLLWCPLHSDVVTVSQSALLRRHASSSVLHKLWPGLTDMRARPHLGAFRRGINP